MNILAFESTAKPASVALVKDGELIAQYTQICGLTHSRTLLPMAEDLLKNTETKLSDIDLLAVAHGPGSFTGVRIGVSTVKGLAWAGEKKCAGVSTLEALAYNGLAAGGLVCPVMDARRDQVYNAIFEIRDGAPARLRPDRAVSLEELRGDADSLGQPLFLTGDGAGLCFDYLTAHGVKCVLAPENLRWQSAWGVAMAADGCQGVSADDILPVYLRLSQAERERQARMNEENK
jgi:tRNA threonylcarbamoyladenosine biosynthesis protein TsaB